MNCARFVAIELPVIVARDRRKVEVGEETNSAAGSARLRRFTKRIRTSSSTMAVLQRHNKPEYKRWVKLLKGLYVVKDVLCPHVEQVLNDFHSNELIGKLGPFCCDAPTLQLVLNKTTNKWSITGVPACTNRCADWLDTIAAEHLHANRKDMYKSCDMTQLATHSWEVGKTFLTPDKARGTNAPADLDPYYIMKVVAQCRLFSQPPNDIHHAVEKVLATRNELAHAAVQGISKDAEVTDKIDEMIDLVKLLPRAPTTTVGDLEKVRDGQIAEIDEELSRREMEVFRMFLEEAQQRGAGQLDRIEQDVLLFMKTNSDIWQRVQCVDSEVQAVGQKVEEGTSRVTGEVQAVKQKAEEGTSRVTGEVHAVGQKVEEGTSRVTGEVQAVGEKVEAGTSRVTGEVQAVGEKVEEGTSRVTGEVQAVGQKVEEGTSRVAALDKKVDELACAMEKISGPARSPDEADTLERLRQELAATYQEHFSKLQPVPWVNVTLPVNLIYQEQTLAGREDMWRLHKENSDLKDVFLPIREGEAPPKLILIEGAPGLGKTTLSQRLILDWAQLVQPSPSGSGAGTQPSSQEPSTNLQPEPLAELRAFDALLFIRVRDLEDGDLADNMRQLLLSSRWQDKARLVQCMEDRSHPVLIIIDGYDEGDERQKACLDACLTGREMKGATIIITSRPGFCHPNPPPDRTYTLQGFDESKQVKYVQQFGSLMGDETGTASTQDLLTPFKGQDFLQFPLLLALVCFLARQGQAVLPKTTTGLYKYFVNFMCDKALEKPSKFHKEYVTNLQRLLQKIASELFAISKTEITENVLRKLGSELDTTETMDNLCKLGLVCQEIKIKGLTTYQSGAFIHQSFMDYFVALNYVSLSKKERSKFLEKTEIYHNALVFVAGLCESGRHSECFTQMLSAWKRQVEARVSPPPFDESDKLSRDMNTMYDQTRDHHSLLHAPLLWLNQLTDPAWLSADNVAAITQTTKGIYLTRTLCTASCHRGLLSLIKACRDLHPSLPRPASLPSPGPLQTLRQAFRRHRGPLTSQTPLHLALYFSRQEDDNTLVYELLHHTLQSRDSVRCVRLSLYVLTREACERLSERLPDLTHLTVLAINISFWEDFVFVSRGFQPTSPLRALTLACLPSRSPDPPSASSLAGSPSSDFLAAISRLHQLQEIRLYDRESSLSRDSRREIRHRLRHRLPHLGLQIYDWDADNNKWKLDASDSPD